MLTVDGLTSAIISRIDSEVAKCSTKDGFRYQSWDYSCYLQAIYDYVKENAKITLLYTGIVGTSTDPASGNHSYKSSSVSTEALKQGVLNIQKGIIEFSPNEWWIKLINSIQIHFTDKSIEDSNNIIISEHIIIPISTKIWSASDFQGLTDYKSIWKIWCGEIIKSIINSTATQVTPSSFPTTSSNGGSGTSVFVKIQ